MGRHCCFAEFVAPMAGWEGLDMTPASDKDGPLLSAEYECAICGTRRRHDEPCCPARTYGGLQPREYAELLWDEA